MVSKIRYNSYVFIISTTFNNVTKIDVSHMSSVLQNPPVVITCEMNGNALNENDIRKNCYKFVGRGKKIDVL